MNESAQAFAALQKIAREEDVVGNAHLVRISRQVNKFHRKSVRFPGKAMNDIYGVKFKPSSLLEMLANHDSLTR